MTLNGKLCCDMVNGCDQPITKIDEKGYIYCDSHGTRRKSSGIYCRKLRPHELRRLERGEPLKRY